MTAEETRAVLRALKTRRSFRKYKSTPVPQELIDQVIEAGTYAASGKGYQPWKVIVVTNEKVKARIRYINAQIMGAGEDADPFYGAPTLLIVLADPQIPTYLYDGALVMGNLLNAAQAVGVGSCYIFRAKEVFDSPEGKKLLKQWGLPERMVGVGNCILGYAAEDGIRPPLPRKQGYIVRT